MSKILTQNNIYFCQAREFAIGGHCKVILANLKGPTSYEAGGSQVDPQAIGAGTKAKLAFAIPTTTDSGTYFVIARKVSLTEFRLVFYVSATGAEVADTTDLDAETFTMAIGFLP